MNKATRSISLLLVFSLLNATFLGCAGRDPIIIPTYQPGDENKSCMALRAELSNLEADVVTKSKEKENKGTGNLLLFLAGLLVIIPFFFMDVKNTEKAEAEQMVRRANALRVIAADKQCDFSGTQAAAEKDKEAVQ